MSKPFVYPFLSQGASCQIKTPVYLLGMGMTLLKQHFGNPDRLSLDKASFLYTDDTKDEKSGLYIGYRDNLDFETVSKRPAIIVDLGDLQFPRDAVGDLIGYVKETGAVNFQDRTIGAWNFTCLSDKPLEAWSLAGEIKFFIQTYRRFIARVYCMDDIRVMSIGGYQRFQEYKDQSGVRVSVGMNFQQNFGISVESLKVSAVDIQILAQPF